MNRLKETREARGFRKEVVAAGAGISLSYVNQLESDDPPTPGLDVARRIAVVLSTTVDKLFPPQTERAAARR